LKKDKSQTSDNSPEGNGSSIDNMKRQREKMANNPVMDQYRDKINKKLGKKEKLFTNFGTKKDDSPDEPLSYTSLEADDSIEDDVYSDDEFDDDTRILEAVERVLEAKQSLEINMDSTPRMVDEMEELAKKMESEQKLKSDQKPTDDDVVDGQKRGKSDVANITSGVGGSWAQDSASKTEIYRPANGGWGYFPRPKDISKAYGGGRKIGADVQTTFEDELRKQRAIEETREKLKRYREKVGIEVQSEKDHAKEIEEALSIAQRAMQRGVYGAAVSSLEKVTKYCSTNSKVGGQIFLELVSRNL
jgi:hypothetical protein